MNPVKNAIGHLISCKDASRLVSQMQERPLTAWQQSQHRTARRVRHGRRHDASCTRTSCARGGTLRLHSSTRAAIP